MPVTTPTPPSDRLTPKSTLRYRPIAPDVKTEEAPHIPRASRAQTQKPPAPVHSDVPTWKAAAHQSVPRSQRVPLAGIGIGMLLAVILVLLGQFLIGWIGTTLDDLHYGRPRTFQVDAIVGHGDSIVHPSHLIALNLHGQIEIIELPAGNAALAKIYMGPHLYGQNADQVPVTLQFIDSQHNHQPEMIALFQGQEMTFSNAQGTFHAPPS